MLPGAQIRQGLALWGPESVTLTLVNNKITRSTDFTEFSHTCCSLIFGTTLGTIIQTKCWLPQTAEHNTFLTLIQFPTRTRQSTPLYPAEEPWISYEPLNTSEVSQCTVKVYTHIYTPARAHTYIKYKPLFSHRLNVYLTLSMCYLYTRVHARTYTHTHYFTFIS